MQSSQPPTSAHTTGESALEVVSYAVRQSPGAASRALNLLEWSYAEECLLVAGIVLACVVGYALAESYVQVHPDVAPYLDPRFLRLSFDVHLVELVWWSALAVLALWCRRRAPASRLLVHVTLQSYIITIVIFSYLLGHLTSFFGGIAVIGGLAVG